MSAVSEPTYQREGNKIRVSMMLKVPIDLELELLGMPGVGGSQIDGSPTGDFGSAVVMSGEGEADFYEEIRVLSNQLVAQLLQDRQVVSTFPQTQHEQDNPANQEEGTTKTERSINTWVPDSEKAVIQSATPPLEKKPTGRLLDSFNNGLTLAVNVVGSALFLGKLANYTWE